MTPSILLQRHEGGALATVTLSNPGKLNAVCHAMWIDLARVMRELSADPQLRCIIVRGAGADAFAAGGDLEEFLTRRDTLPHALEYHEGAVAPALRALADCPVPTIALIHGACVGGGLEIACCCDLRIAGATARFGAPINRLGFSMYPGEMEMVLRVASPVVAAEILLEGRLLDAQEAYAKGLLTRVVPDAQVDDEAIASARRIAGGAPLVARWHKRWLARVAQGAPLTDAEKAESFAFLDTADYREGMAAFLEKRRPAFRGK